MNQVLPSERGHRPRLLKWRSVNDYDCGSRVSGDVAGGCFGIGNSSGIGFEGRYDYAAIGTVTNLGARLCGEAKSGQIVVSQRVAAEVDTIAELEPLGALSLKGFHGPVRAHNIIGLK